MSGTATTDPLADATQLAKQHGLFITEVTDDVYDFDIGRMRYVPAWVVYRSAPKGCRPIRIGKRRNPRALLAFVKKLIGEGPR